MKVFFVILGILKDDYHCSSATMPKIWVKKFPWQSDTFWNPIASSVETFLGTNSSRPINCHSKWVASMARVTLVPSSAIWIVSTECGVDLLVWQLTRWTMECGHCLFTLFCSTWIDLILRTRWFFISVYNVYIYNVNFFSIFALLASSININVERCINSSAKCGK